MHRAPSALRGCGGDARAAPPRREDPLGSPGMPVATPTIMPEPQDQQADELPPEVFDIDELVAEPDDLVDDGEITQRIPRIPSELD